MHIGESNGIKSLLPAAAVSYLAADVSVVKQETVTAYPAKCIYCGHEDHPFDREHVMPEAFGTFAPESLILYDAVCQPCNNYFGRTLELALSRDSFEALLRLRYGIKPASEAKELPYRKIELKVGQPGGWFGATVVLETDSTGRE